MWHLFGSVLNKHASYIWRFVDQDISAALQHFIMMQFGHILQLNQKLQRFTFAKLNLTILGFQ